VASGGYLFMTGLFNDYDVQLKYRNNPEDECLVILTKYLNKVLENYLQINFMTALLRIWKLIWIYHSTNDPRFELTRLRIKKVKLFLLMA